MWQVRAPDHDGSPYRVEVSVNGTSLVMELDTGASVSVVSEVTFRRTFPSCLEPSSAMLKGYTGELCPVQGSLPATVRLGNHECRDVLYVVPGRCPSLMGPAWMKGLGIELHKAPTPEDVKVLQSYLDLVNFYRREDPGAERPIAFASRSLAPAERTYSHLDKEALALMFGVTKFRQYLWGREFGAITDHKPLLGLLAPDKRVPEMCSPRIMRWALMLGAYNYKLMYRPGASIASADGLSRLPLPVHAQPVERPAEHFMLEAAYHRVLRSTVVAEATSKVPTLAKLRDALWSGAELRDPEFRSYADRKLQMSVQEELLGSRVVIPSASQQEVLRLLHEGHPGMTKMNAVARSHVWWSSLDEDITAAVRQCQEYSPRNYRVLTSGADHGPSSRRLSMMVELEPRRPQDPETTSTHGIPVRGQPGCQQE
ncbi:hypothetical protein MTO96_008615 [Rhipicephalus appendiculatus]